MSTFVSKYPRPPKPVRRVPPGRAPVIGALAKAMLNLLPPVVAEDGTRTEDSIPYDRLTRNGAYHARRRLIKSKLVDEDEFKIAVYADPTGEARWRIWRTL
jgi:hypothetical protein